MPNGAAEYLHAKLRTTACPGLIRGGHRFADKNMRETANP